MQMCVLYPCMKTKQRLHLLQLEDAYTCTNSQRVQI